MILAAKIDGALSTWAYANPIWTDTTTLNTTTEVCRGMPRGGAPLSFRPRAAQYKSPFWSNFSFTAVRLDFTISGTTLWCDWQCMRMAMGPRPGTAGAAIARAQDLTLRTIRTSARGFPCRTRRHARCLVPVRACAHARSISRIAIAMHTVRVTHTHTCTCAAQNSIITTVPRANWSYLMGNRASFQPYCNQQGVNAARGTSKAIATIDIDRDHDNVTCTSCNQLRAWVSS
jgi:hypothetical protein